MRLAAIVFTDIVGFSKLTEGDEVTGLGMEIGELKTDATWDPVRDHEIFKAIVQ